MKRRLLQRSLPFGICLLAAFLTVFLSVARAYDRIYAFGDSLSDTGNVPAPATNYFAGRYSNGKLWLEYLSPELGFEYQRTDNFAQADSPTATVFQQVTNFAPHGDLQQALFVLWAGGVDFINAAPIGFNEDAWAAVINGAVNNLSNSVEVLITKGARTIAIPNAIDLTRTPGAATLPAIYKPYALSKLLTFNASLATTLQGLKNHHRGIRIIALDLWNPFNDLLDHPQMYGFSKTDIGVLQDTSLTDKSFDGPGQTFLFWDEIHPTTRAHRILADWFYATLVGPLQLDLKLEAGRPALVLNNLQLGREFQILATTDFKSWDVLSDFTATAASIQQTDLGAAEGYKFFRLLRQN